MKYELLNDHPRRKNNKDHQQNYIIAKDGRCVILLPVHKLGHKRGCPKWATTLILELAEYQEIKLLDKETTNQESAMEKESSA